MPLDDREQKILEEIERQFYQEDPKLAETVRSATLASMSARNLKWAILAFALGAVLMFGFFTRVTLVALVGFAVMVLAVVWIVGIFRRRSGVGSRVPEAGPFARLRRRWRDR